MINIKAGFLLVGFFSFMQITNPGVCEKYSRTEMRNLLEGIDSPHCWKQVSQMAKNSPKALEEVLLMSDSKNFYGRWSGINIWQSLASEGVIEVEKYYDVTIQLFAKLMNLTPPHFFEMERRHFLEELTSFGRKPLKKIPIYQGLESSFGFYEICSKALRKYKFIKTEETAKQILNKISEIKKMVGEKEKQGKGEIVIQLRTFIKDLVLRQNDLTPDGYAVLMGFAQNLIFQIEKQN